MRFLVDEGTGVAVANWLRMQNYEVFSVYEQARGLIAGVTNPPGVQSEALTKFCLWINVSSCSHAPKP